jgi:aminocarboxymuconate-semialdehyde decarboxylase
MVPNRRVFLKAAVNAGGLVFVGCGLTEVAAGFAQPAGRGTRTPVVLRGRRVRTIDMHAHCAVPKAAAVLNRNGAVNAQDPLLMEGPALAERLARMDAQQIDVAVLSINPNWYDATRDVVVDVIRIQNEGLAEFCGAHADRFAALASVALQFPDLAAQQLEHAVKTLGLHGVAVGGSVAGMELSDEKLHPFWAKAEELGVVVFIHPQASGVLTNRLKGNGLLTNVIWNPLETTIALSHLIFEGTLDRFPGVKICAAHGGGYLPSYMNRSDHGCTTFPAQCKAGVPKKHPTEYVKQMYYDSLVFTPEALRHLVAEVGAGQIVMGTDYPYPWVTEPVRHILETPGLNDTAREAILGGTAAKLLGLSGK